MEKQPLFLKEFSKKNSSEERDQAAQEIREKRKEHFDRKSEQDGKREAKDEVVLELEALAESIRNYNDAGFLQKIKDYFSIQKTKAELNEKMGIQQTLEESLVQAESGRSELDEARQIVKRFYDQEKQKWADAPYSKEDMAENFTEEHLSSLSLEEYELLMKRFPGQMVTHVSRQGVRDHNGMYEHSKGMGESHSNFQDMLASKRMLSPLGVAISQAETYHDICQFLNGGEDVVTHRDVIGDGRQPMDLRRLVTALKWYTDSTDRKHFHNKTAIHLAVEQVLGGIYGGERGNEVFVIYPSAHIASQYMFKNWGHDLLNPQDSSNAAHNDVYVWNRWKEGEEAGMSIDAGVVFLPKNATVDPETGSLYRLDESGKPIPATVDPNKQEPNTLYLQKTDRGISSEEYWETYFAQHPSSRPSKIVYYDAAMTPTAAMWKWKADNGIVDKQDAANLGFTEHQVGDDWDRPVGEQEMDDFHQLAMDALVEEYGAGSVLFAYDPSVAERPSGEWNERAKRMYTRPEQKGRVIGEKREETV